MKNPEIEIAVKLRHELHRRAELSGGEEKTKAFLMNWLRETDSTGRIAVVDGKEWFYAAILCGKEKNAMPPIAFRAEMDALPIPEDMTLPYASENPAVSHRCGHDGHAANLAVCAMLLAKEDIPRDIYFIFQHAEEIGGGGEACAKLIREKQIRSIYAFHNWSGYPADALVVIKGVTHCASEGITFSFHGKTSHASQPEDGNNPAPAIAEIILAAKTMEKEDCFTNLVMATVVHAGVGSKNFGVNAGDGSVSMTLRGVIEAEMIELERMLTERAEELAKKQGLELVVEKQDVFPETVNTETAIEKILAAANGKNLPVIVQDTPIRSSEDFGYYLKECDGALFYVGNGESYPQIHTIGYDYRDENFAISIPMFLTLARIG